MKRRQALRAMTYTTGAGLFLSSFAGCYSESYQPIFFSKKELSLIDEIAETILPRTPDSPGAKDIDVANFMDLFIHDCSSIEEQQIVSDGLLQLQDNCSGLYNDKFQDLKQEDKVNYLIQLDLDSKKLDQPHYFKILKKLIIFSYFSSKEGMEQALSYIPIPQKYIGVHSFNQDQKAWAL